MVESIEATIWYLGWLSVDGRYQTIRDLVRAPNKSKMKGIEIAGFAASVDRWKRTSRCRLEPEGKRKRRKESTIKATAIFQRSLHKLSSSFLLSGNFFRGLPDF